MPVVVTVTVTLVFPAFHHSMLYEGIVLWVGGARVSFACVCADTRRTDQKDRH